MAFLSARILPGGYKNHSLPDGTPNAISITGEILDDAIEGAYVGTCWIEGESFQSLPAADPELDGTPADPRFQAIMGHVAAFVARAHAAWSDSVLNTPVVTAKSDEEIAALPVLTSLPSLG